MITSTLTPTMPVPEKILTARHVHEYLDATGCNESTLKLVAQFQESDPDGNAQACLDYLVGQPPSVGVQPGTLNRLGKKIHGPQWEWVPAGSNRTVSQEVVSLRLQVATLRDQLQETQARNRALMFENQKLRKAQAIEGALGEPGRIDQSGQLAAQVLENDERNPRRRGRPPRVTGGIGDVVGEE